MQNSHIYAMASAIENYDPMEGDDPDRQRFIVNTLSEYWSDRMALVWHIQDIQNRGQAIDRILTDDEARDILWKLYRDNDPMFGICLPVIDACIRENHPTSP